MCWVTSWFNDGVQVHQAGSGSAPVYTCRDLLACVLFWVVFWPVAIGCEEEGVSCRGVARLCVALLTSNGTPGVFDLGGSGPALSVPPRAKATGVQTNLRARLALSRQDLGVSTWIKQ